MLPPFEKYNDYHDSFSLLQKIMRDNL